MKYLIFIMLLLLAITGLTGTLAMASDTSNAVWYGVVTVTNNSTAETNVSTVFTANTTSMQALGYINAGCNNTAMLNTSGADIAYMPGYAGNPWCVFVPTIGANSNLNDTLYTGGTTNMSGKLAVFGLLDIGDFDIGTDNQSIEITRYVDFASANDTLMEKPDMLTITKSATGNITATPLGWGWITSFTDPSAVWTNEANGYDGDTSTYTERAAIPANTWSEYIQFAPTNPIAIRGIRTNANDGGGAVIDKIDVDAFYGGGWNNVYEGSFPHWTFQEHPLFQTVSEIRVRLHNTAGAARNGRIYEVELMPTPLDASGLSDGDKTIRFWQDGTNMHLSINGAEADNTTAVNLIDNANDIHLDANPYLTGFELAVGGTDECIIHWEYDTTLTDLSGSGNDATLTPRTTSSDPHVSATLFSFAPVAEAQAPAYTLEDPPDFIDTTPAASGNFTVNYNTVNITAPGWNPIKQIAIAGAVPENLIAVILSTLGLLMLSLAISYMNVVTGHDDLLIKFMIIIAAMCVLVALAFYDVWQVYFFVLLGLAIMWLSRQREAY